METVYNEQKLTKTCVYGVYITVFDKNKVPDPGNGE